MIEEQEKTKQDTITHTKTQIVPTARSLNNKGLLVVDFSAELAINDEENFLAKASDFIGLDLI